MTTEEAISILETNAINATGTLGGLPQTAAEKSGLNRQIEALDMAIAALEKQIPKKPKEYEDKYYACPVCGNVLLHKREKYPTKLMSKNNGLPYCLSCGQAIDWSEEE